MFLQTAKSGDSQFNSLLQLPSLLSYLIRAQHLTDCSLGNTELDWLFSTEIFFITTLHRPNGKHRFQQYHYCCVFTDPLLGNGFFCCCVRVHFRGNLITEPLPSNELFRLTGVMSQYSKFIVFFAFTLSRWGTNAANLCRIWRAHTDGYDDTSWGITLCVPLKFSSAWYLLHSGFCMAYFSALKMEATYTPETSVDIQWTTRRYIPEDRTLIVRLIRSQLLLLQKSPISAVELEQ
jgi:hypothetical protein